jgi:hypothetical protein
MTEEELLREIVDELGVGATPNEIAIALHDWFDSVPENPRDELWREVFHLLFDGAPSTADTERSNEWHQRRAVAYRAVQIRRGAPH